MQITKANIHELPHEWARELADNLVCDCPKSAYMLEVQGPYKILEEFWPDCEPDVREMLEQLTEMEEFYSA